MYSLCLDFKYYRTVMSSVTKAGRFHAKVTFVRLDDHFGELPSTLVVNTSVVLRYWQQWPYEHLQSRKRDSRRSPR